MKSLNSRKVIKDPNVRVLVFPFFALLILITIFLSIAFFSYQQVTQKLSLLKDYKEQTVRLEEKLETLKQIEKSSIVGADVTLTVLPVVNPVFWGISNLSKYAPSTPEANLLMKSVRLSNVTVNTPTSNYTLEVSFEGDFISFYNFYEQFKNALPIFSLSGFSYEGNQIKMILEYYQSELPEKIPALTEPIIHISEDNQSLISKLERYQKPEFQILDTLLNEERESPFTFTYEIQENAPVDETQPQ